VEVNLTPFFEQKDPTPRRSGLRAKAKRPEVRPSRADARAKGVVAGTPRLAAKAHSFAGTLRARASAIERRNSGMESTSEVKG
jgi:hypothetical protein